MAQNKKIEKIKKISIFLLLFIIFFLIIYNFKHLFLVAVVNKKPITRFALDRELEKQGGQQILDSLITKSLIFQEAQKQGIKINEEKVKQRIEEIEKEIESQGSSLNEILEAQRQTRKNLEEQIKIQLTLEEILGKDISLTNEEVKSYFEKNKNYYTEGTTFEEVQDEIRRDLKQTKMGEKYSSWIEDLRQKAKIYYFIKF